MIMSAVLALAAFFVILVARSSMGKPMMMAGKFWYTRFSDAGVLRSGSAARRSIIPVLAVPVSIQKNAMNWAYCSYVDECLYGSYSCKYQYGADEVGDEVYLYGAYACDYHEVEGKARDPVEKVYVEIVLFEPSYLFEKI